MGQTLSVVLDDARRRGFVGRAAQVRAFDAALSGAGPIRVLLLHGVGGIGKTTLLLEPAAGPSPPAGRRCCSTAATWAGRWRLWRRRWPLSRRRRTGADRCCSSTATSC
jgi:hypothetical protein